MADIKGREIRAFLFCCAGCEKQMIRYYTGTIAIRSTDAAAEMRQAGWSKKVNGWHCQECRQRREKK